MKTDIPILQQTDEQILETVRQLQVAYKLKRTLRYSTERDFSVHNESVAEHIFALMFLLQYFLPLEDPKNRLDVVKIYRIILFHDFGEIPNGDIPYHQKTAAHEQREREDAQRVFASLPPPIQDEARESWAEYEERLSLEAQFVYALDKIESLFELLDPVNEHSMKRLKFTYKMHIEKKLLATEKYPVMRRFVEVVSKDMASRNVFWEEH